MSRQIPVPPGLFIVLLAAVVSPAEFHAALPEWAEAVAEAAPPLPEGVPDHPFRVLLSETREAIQSDGTVRIRRRYVTQALSVHTEDVDTGYFHFQGTTKMTGTRAWHLPPEARAKRSRSAPVDITMSDAFLGDNRLRAVPVRDVKKGSVVFFEFEAVDRPYFYALSHRFFQQTPVLTARYELETPPGWTVRPAWVGQPGPAARVTGNVHVWELQIPPAPKAEPLAEDPAVRAPLLVVQVIPPAGAGRLPATFSDWTALALWYEELAKGRNSLTPSIETTAKEATTRGSDGWLDRVRAAAILVRDKVRYTAVELGIGGVQPRAASDTLANLYGDCKDKATLFSSILSALEIPAHPVLIYVGDHDLVSPETPVFAFNHMVAAVPLPPELEIPASIQPAVVEAGDLGRLLIVDTTNDRASVGSLPVGLAGHHGLVVTGIRSRLVRLPEMSASANRIERRIRMGMGPGGSLEVGRESRFTGVFAELVRDKYLRSASGRRKEVEAANARQFPGAVPMEYDTEPETTEGSFVERVSFEQPSSGTAGSGVEVWVFPWAEGDVERAPLGRRQTAVVYPAPMTVRHEAEIRGVPQSAVVPSDRSAEGDGWSVRTEFRREGDFVQATWEARLVRTRFEPGAFPELRKFWNALSSGTGYRLPVGSPTP